MLSAHDLSAHVRRHTLLQGVSLRIEPGEVLALIGMNGAGKSTLLNILSGDRTPDGGQVRLADRPLAAWPLRELAKRRAVLPQESRLAFPFSALEVVLMGRHPYHAGYPTRSDARLASRVMAELDVAHLRERSFPALSGGERARVQLARALCQVLESDVPEPRLLLLDEPTASLDPAHQHAVLAAVRRFTREEGGAVCVVLHDLNLAAQYADRIALLADGRLDALGTPWEVLTGERLGLAYGLDFLVMPHPRLDHPLIASLRRNGTQSYICDCK